MPRFTTSDSVSLHYTDEGQGLPVLCLAGLTRDGHDFDDVAPHLRDVRLIRLDYRGRGQSDWANHETYTIPVEGRDALELLDHLGLDRAAVLGTSRGGLIAMVLAASAKDRLLGVALNDIGPEIDDAGLVLTARQLHQQLGKFRPDPRERGGRSEQGIEQGGSHIFEMYPLNGFGKADKRETSRYRGQSTEKVSK